MIALIAAKENSERVPNKNTKPFADTTLLELKIRQLQTSCAFDQVVVSSDSKVLLDRAEKLGALPWERAASLCQSDTPMGEVYHALADRFFGEFGDMPLAWVQCNNPLVEGPYYTKAVRAWNAKTDAYDCLVSVHRVHEYLIKDGQPFNFTRFPWGRSQDQLPMYSLNFAICILRARDMYNWSSLIGKRPLLFEIPRADATDIDWPEDWAYCEAEYKLRNPASCSYFAS